MRCRRALGHRCRWLRAVARSLRRVDRSLLGRCPTTTTAREALRHLHLFLHQCQCQWPGLRPLEYLRPPLGLRSPPRLASTRSSSSSSSTRGRRPRSLSVQPRDLCRTFLSCQRSRQTWPLPPLEPPRRSSARLPKALLSPGPPSSFRRLPQTLLPPRSPLMSLRLSTTL